MYACICIDLYISYECIHTCKCIYIILYTYKIETCIFLDKHLRLFICKMWIGKPYPNIVLLWNKTNTNSIISQVIISVSHSYHDI